MGLNVGGFWFLRTDKRFAEISNVGAMPMLRSDRQPGDDKMAKNVVICIPPSTPNYMDGW
jgi:hypothetical protein